MILFHKTIASWFGIGYVEKGAGTIAAAFVCIVIGYFSSRMEDLSLLLLATSLLLAVIGSWSSHQCEKIWGEDSNRIVVDEVFGMAITLLFIPLNYKTIIIGFILFRLFDIFKPLYIRKMEKFGGGIGVMADDLLAGIYANILLQIITRTNLL
jgi:phosphatidylglycerophosphatase A